MEGHESHRQRRPGVATTRWTAIVIIPVLVAAFVILYLCPSRTTDLWAWTVVPTMTAMLTGSGYMAGAWFFLRVGRSRYGHQAGPGLVAVRVFTTMLLEATILHWDRFNHRHVSFWAWLATDARWSSFVIPWRA